jgi:hypothetical protein
MLDLLFRYRVSSLKINNSLILITLLCLLIFTAPCILWASPLPPQGIKLGSQGSFHPRLFFNTGYDSNVYHRSYQSDIRSQENLRYANITGAPFIGIRPGLQLNLPTNPVGFYLAGYANYSHYFPIQDLSTITAKADLVIQFLAESAFSFAIRNNFSRNTGDLYTASDMFERALYFYRPGTQSGGSSYITHENISNITFKIKPGGDALVFDLGYQFQFGFYPSDQTDHHIHRINLDAKWNFFPRTSFTFESALKIVNFAPRFNFNRISPNNNMLPFKAYVGLVGQLTERIIVTLRAGGGYTFVQAQANSPDDDYGMLIGNIDFTYKFFLHTHIRLGFRHDFNESFFANFLHETVGYVDFGTKFGPGNRPFTLNIRGDIGYLGYGKIPSNFGSDTGRVIFNSHDKDENGNVLRKEMFVRGNVDFDWQIFPFWMLGITARIAFHNSNTFYFPSATAIDQIGFGFIKFEAFLKTELAY